MDELEINIGLRKMLDDRDSKLSEQELVILFKGFSMIESLMLDGWVHVSGPLRAKNEVLKDYDNEKEFAQYKVFRFTGLDDILLIGKNKTYFKRMKMSPKMQEESLYIYNIEFDSKSTQRDITAHATENPLMIKNHVDGMLLRAIFTLARKNTIKDLIDHGWTILSKDIKRSDLPKL